MSIPRKKCSKCGRRRPCTQFYYHPMTKDNLQSQCKDCMKAAADARQFKRIQKRLGTPERLRGGKGVALKYWAQSRLVEIRARVKYQKTVEKWVKAFDRPWTEKYDEEKGLIVVRVTRVNPRWWKSVMNL